MKFTEILEELKKGEKVTREEWEKVKTYRYKYIKLEHGDCVAYLKDDTVRHKGEELTTWVGCVFGCADFTAEDWKIYEEKPTRIWKPEFGEKYYYITTSGDVAYNTFNTSLDEYRLSFRNVFKTAEDARKMVEKIKIINQLQELSNVDFYHNCEGKKYLIIYNSKLKKIDYTIDTSKWTGSGDLYELPKKDFFENFGFDYKKYNNNSFFISPNNYRSNNYQRKKSK